MMTQRQVRTFLTNGFLMLAVFALVSLHLPAMARMHSRNLRTFGHDAPYHAQIKSFSVTSPDDILSYPTYLLDFPDEHVTFLPFTEWSPSPEDNTGKNFLAFGSSKVSKDGTGGAVVLQTNDLVNFSPATGLGYTEQVMAPPIVFTTCDPNYNTEFDENYAGPGSVLQDPTLPPGNLIMLYEAENHCPGPPDQPIHTNQHSFYATVGFARSSDNGRTWPPPANGEFGNADRHPVLKGPIPEPTANFDGAMGDAIPSGFVDVNDKGEAYLYVTYGFSAGGAPPFPNDGAIRVARAKLGHVHREFGDDDRNSGDHSSDSDQDTHKLQFYKWYENSFSQPGIAGLDTGVISTTGCTGRQQMGHITHNDDLGLYMMIFVCNNTSSDGTAAWYYSTATSLDLQNWSEPQKILNSEKAVISPCNTNTNPPTGDDFDGFYVSFMSPDAPAGQLRLTGKAFFERMRHRLTAHVCLANFHNHGRTLDRSHA